MPPRTVSTKATDGRAARFLNYLEAQLRIGKNLNDAAKGPEGLPGERLDFVVRQHDGALIRGPLRASLTRHQFAASVSRFRILGQQDR
jgi:hypothetical protein